MAQFARPDSDITETLWEEDDGTTVDQWDEINETVASNTDYVRSPLAPATASNELEVGLSNVTDPVSSTGHIIRWRAQAPVASGASVQLRVILRQSTTAIATNAFETLATSWTDDSYTLTGGEADAITDYNDLRLEFVANQI